MDPNQSASTSASSQGTTSSASDTQAQDIQQPVTQYQESASTSATSQPTSTQPQQPETQSKPADGKNWLEYAGLQKVVDQLPQGVRDIIPNSVDQFNKLSTTQKIAGAVALAGLGYLALRPSKSTQKPSGKYTDKSKGSYAGSYGTYRSGAVGTSTYGQSYGSGSRPDASRRMDQGPGWWNNNGSGPDDDSSQTRESRNASYGNPAPTDSYSRGLSSRNRRDEEYRNSSSQGTSAGRASDADFGSGA